MKKDVHRYVGRRVMGNDDDGGDDDDDRQIVVGEKQRQKKKKYQKGKESLFKRQQFYNTC